MRTGVQFSEEWRTFGRPKHIRAQLTVSSFFFSTSATGETRLEDGNMEALHEGQVKLFGVVVGGSCFAWWFKHAQWKTSVNTLRKQLELRDNYKKYGNYQHTKKWENGRYNIISVFRLQEHNIRCFPKQEKIPRLNDWFNWWMSNNLNVNFSRMYN